MNILYITQTDTNLNEKGIYVDLINQLRDNGHKVTMVEATSHQTNSDKMENGVRVIGVRVGEQYGVNVIKKGFVLMTLEGKMKKAIKKYLSGENFDLLLYATPPITFSGVIQYCKEKFNCKTYLMLKDIFPQNAVDMGMFAKKGVSGYIYKHFKQVEQKLYALSDKIGCMSPANIEYLVKNDAIERKKLEIFPNAIKVDDLPNKMDVKSEYNIPKDHTVFIYGGNLGVPQGLDFVVKGIKACKNLKATFIIIGKGSEKQKVFNALAVEKNAICLERISPLEYRALVAGCDVGIVALDYRFTIPNYPSRILSYLESGIPVFACTDRVSDIKELVETEAKCGRWCYSDDLDAFVKTVKVFINNKNNFKAMGDNGYRYLDKNFNILNCVEKLESFMQEEK